MPGHATCQGGKARLRPSLYVRDDDYRYSVLYGSFITLTGLSAEDWARLEEQSLSPLYVSIHATEPSLRRRLLGREDIPDILPQLDRLADMGIEVHTQIVLVPGVNDGPHLQRTIDDLAERHPFVRSIGVVPVGLTRFHGGSCRTYTPQEARAIVEQLSPMQIAFRAQHGVSLLYLADEWYLLGGLDVPSDEWYDDYAQIENGIGLVRQLLEDARRLSGARSPGSTLPKATNCTLVCGTLISSLMKRLVGEMAAQIGIHVEILPVVNRLFGPSVTVSGLLGGAEVLAALRNRELGDVVYLPRVMFSEPPDRGGGELRTLDDLCVADFTAKVGRTVVLAQWLSEVCL
jgi:putative radical SAM enzyme (TIGR03279 family)